MIVYVIIIIYFFLALHLIRSAENGAQTVFFGILCAAYTNQTESMRKLNEITVKPKKKHQRQCIFLLRNAFLNVYIMWFCLLPWPFLKAYFHNLDDFTLIFSFISSFLHTNHVNEHTKIIKYEQNNLSSSIELINLHQHLQSSLEDDLERGYEKTERS